MNSVATPRQYHAFSNGKVHVAFDPEALLFGRLNDEGWEQAQRGTLVLADPSALPSPPSPSPGPAAPEAPKDKRAPLERLVFILTTHCNLRCRYCYASGGNYGMALKHMPVEVVTRALEWALENYSIQMIQFFGGEPSLTPGLVELVCREINQRIAAAGEAAGRPPQYGLVTNGVHFPPELEEIVSRYGINLTFSFDGPADVHDHYRVSADGKGSFKAALANYHKLRASGRMVVGTEVTVTPYALEAGRGIWELVQFCASELNLPEAHIVPVCSAEPSAAWDEDSATKLVESYRHATVCSLNNLLEGRLLGFSFLSGVLRSLILRRSRPLICAAGAGTLAIDPEGDIYPCFMFAGQSRRVLGNVIAGVDPRLFNEGLAAFSPFGQKQAHPRCRDCWVRQACSSCVGNHEQSTGRLDGEWELVCRILRVVAEETMLFLAEAQGTPEAWRRFVEQYKRARLVSTEPC